MATPAIQYLRRDRIDTVKWDRCIGEAPNGLVYAYSFYLDHMARHWDALVMGDYEAVMPLTWNRKWGIQYLYQPFCTAQLGVFSQKKELRLTDLFLKQIPPAFRYIDIDLNESDDSSLYLAEQRKNYVLPLNDGYEVLQKQYNRHARRKLRKAMEAGLTIQEGIGVEKVTALWYGMMSRKGEPFDREDGARFEKLFYALQQKVEACNTIAAVDAAGRIVSGEVYMVTGQRVYSVLAGNTVWSDEQGAFYLVLDHLVRRYAGSGYLLDFEGSDIPGIAFLFECLGGQLRYYPHLRLNRLPVPLKWLK